MPVKLAFFYWNIFRMSRRHATSSTRYLVPGTWLGPIYIIYWPCTLTRANTIRSTVPAGTRSIHSMMTCCTSMIHVFAYDLL